MYNQAHSDGQEGKRLNALDVQRAMVGTYVNLSAWTVRRIIRERSHSDRCHLTHFLTIINVFHFSLHSHLETHKVRHSRVHYRYFVRRYRASPRGRLDILSDYLVRKIMDSDDDDLHAWVMDFADEADVEPVDPVC